MRRFFYLTVKATLHRLFCITEEDCAIEYYKMGKPKRLHKWLKRCPNFVELDYKTYVSKSGRIMHIKDLYDRVEIDRGSLDRYKFKDDYLSSLEVNRKTTELVSILVYKDTNIN